MMNVSDKLLITMDPQERDALEKELHDVLKPVFKKGGLYYANNYPQIASLLNILKNDRMEEHSD